MSHKRFGSCTSKVDIKNTNHIKTAAGSECSRNNTVNSICHAKLLVKKSQHATYKTPKTS